MVFIFPMRIMMISAEPGREAVTRARGGIFDLPSGLSDGDVVTVCSPVDHGYLEVRNRQGVVFNVAMQEIDSGTLYEVAGTFLPPSDKRVRSEVARQRALGFRHLGFEEITEQIVRLNNPPLRPYRVGCQSEPPPDIFEQSRRAQ
jgi:hypothetical protein